jgi:small subunit ribosomal protein S4
MEKRERKVTRGQRPGGTEQQEVKKTNPGKKVSEYGRQLSEKQKVKHMYGLRERQFYRFFSLAVRAQGAPGENLLSYLERRLDNVVYRLKMAKTRVQARQMVVHGHVLLNGSKVTIPSCQVSIGDVISLAGRSLERIEFIDAVVDKRMKMAIKVPDWLELNKHDRIGRVLRKPVRGDIQVPIQEHLIVELYSK